MSDYEFDLVDVAREWCKEYIPSHTVVAADRLKYLEQVEAIARTLREPYQQGGPSAEFVTLRRLLERGEAG